MITAQLSDKLRAKLSVLLILYTGGLFSKMNFMNGAYSRGGLMLKFNGSSLCRRKSKEKNLYSFIKSAVCQQPMVDYWFNL